MSKYQPRITPNLDGSWFALIVRVDKDGEENVVHGYKSRHFSSFAAAQKSTGNYIRGLETRL